MTTESLLDPRITADVLEAVFTGQFPEQPWDRLDDGCDCTYQRVGFWTNPYLAETLEVRLCCIWAELHKQYPQFVRVLPGYWNGNTKEWETEPVDWNGEETMPSAIWHRQLARKHGISVSEARALNLPPPQGRPIVRPKVWLPWSGDFLEVTLG